MVNVGLVTGTATPSSRQAPRTNVVLPAPSSPSTSTASPAARSPASRARSASVSAALWDRKEPCTTDTVERGTTPAFATVRERHEHFGDRPGPGAIVRADQ